ncbi:MAG: HEPN domain-containing protein [Solirubrobacterales bacterium]
MSPRSKEFMDQAHDRLAIAREILDSGHLAGAVSAAYFAMLYAARAALSERDEYAKTHGGTWHLFRERYVATEAFDEGLYTIATSAQTTREQGDYEAVTPDAERAKAIVEGAADFIPAVEQMLDA